MDGWGTVTQDATLQWGVNAFAASTNDGDGWGNSSTTANQSSGWDSNQTNGKGQHNWAEMSSQMESTFISSNDNHHDGDREEFRPRRATPPVEEIEAPIPLEETWPGFKEADMERDLDDVKMALGELCTSFRGSSWQDMEKKLRDEKCNTYLAAVDDKVLFGYTLVNLRNEPGQRYRVIPSFIKPGSAKSGRMSIGFASSYEENFERLAEGGIVRPSGIPKCHNCKQDGHIASACPEEKRLPEKSEHFGKCYNCDSEEHRTRNCPEERKVLVCNNCKQEGHIAKACTEPPAAMVCNRCGQEGHMSRDCDQPRTDITCNRCGQEGHMSRDCDQPRTDITCNRCNECNEQGHMSFECPSKGDGRQRGPRKYGFGF
ncbi:hypothetical protein BG004_003349 [Podila humilis]|nr:hypothetical protein BG004_003349 [Podila humilis]